MSIRKFVSSLFVIGVVILGSSGAAYADCDGVRCKRVKIKALYVRADNLIDIDTSGDERQLTCLPRDGRYIDLQKTHLNYKEIYAALLAARIFDRSLQIRVRSGPNRECLLAYIVV